VVVKYRINNVILAETLARSQTTDMAEMTSCLQFCLFAQRASPWWVGDLVLSIEERFGDDFWQDVPDGFSIDAITRWCAVARKVPRQNRRSELSWTHHAIVANLDQAIQRQLLAHAVVECLPSGEFRKYVCQWKKGNL